MSRRRGPPCRDCGAPTAIYRVGDRPPSRCPRCREDRMHARRRAAAKLRASDVGNIARLIARDTARAKVAERAIARGRCRKRCEAGHLWTPRSVSEPCPVCAGHPEAIGPIVARVMATIQGRRTA